MYIGLVRQSLFAKNAPIAEFPADFFYCNYSCLHPNKRFVVLRTFHKSGRKTLISYGVLHEGCISKTACEALRQNSKKKLIHQRSHRKHICWKGYV